MRSFVLSNEICYVFRVDEDNQHATAAEEMRQISVNCAVNSHCQVDVATTAVNTKSNGGSVTAPEKQYVKIDVLNDSGEKEFEYSSSVKIGSSFVADSLVPDISLSGEPDVMMLNQSGSAKHMSGDADMDCHLQMSDGECLQKRTCQKLVDSAYIREHEQTSRLDNVIPLVSPCPTRGSNMVRILITIYMVVTFIL